MQAALFLIKHERFKETLDLLAQAYRHVSELPQLLITEAITLELLNKTDEAIKRLAQLQARWPEWDLPYFFQGIILEINRRSLEARPVLETAVALGAQNPLVYFYLASAIFATSPTEMEVAQKNVERALELNSSDPQFLTLAGRVALARKDYPTAIHYLNEAVRLQPNLLEAFWGLSTAYRSTGDKEKLAATIAEIERLNKMKPEERYTLDSKVKDLLFTVGPPSRSQ